MNKAPILHKQQIRFIIDVEVSIRDLPQALIDDTEIINHYQTWKTENRDDFNEHMEFQKRILYALLDNKEVTSQFVVEAAGSEAAEDLTRSYHSNHAPSTEEILLPVLNKLNADDKKRLEDSSANGVFSENTETALFEAFESKIINSIIEVIDDDTA